MIIIFALMEHAYNDMFGENIWTQEIGGRPVKEIVKEELLENMIREKLIMAYVDKSGYEPSEEEIKEAFDNFKEVLETDEETKSFYEEMSFGDDFIKNQIKSQFYAEEFNNMIREDIKQDEEKLNALYETETVLVSASHILVNDDATMALVQENLTQAKICRAGNRVFSRSCQCLKWWQSGILPTWEDGTRI